jgi:hypothetical protein
MRIVFVLACAMLVVWANVPSANASGANGLVALCAAQGGTWFPNGVNEDGTPGPECLLGSNGFILDATVPYPSSFARVQLRAAAILCRTLGFSGVITGGIGVPQGQFVAAWWCSGRDT